MELTRYFTILQKRVWIILLTAVITTLVVVVVDLRAMPRYTAISKLRVVPFSINAPDYGTFVYFDRLANTYSEILKSPIVTDEVKKRLDLTKLPNYSIETIPQTELMRLTVEAEDPTLAMNVANTMVGILIERNQTLSNATDGGVQTTLKQRLTALEAELNSLIAERTTLLNQVPRDAEKLDAIERTIDSRQQIYSLTLSSYNQALVSQSAMASALSKVEDAELPDQPSGPMRGRDAGIGAAVGLLGGVALAFILEMLRPRLYVEKQLEMLTEVPVIGRIPRLSKRALSNIFTIEPVIQESFRRLRANVLTIAKADPANRLLLVTSSVADEGKSVVAANLAVSLARADLRTVLVDCDLHRPALHTAFNKPNEVGLSSILTEQADLSQAIQETSEPKLQVVTSGPYAENSAELLGSTTMSALTGQLLSQYDMVILDSPALLAVSDSKILAPCAGGVLMVVDMAKVDEKTVAAAHEQLEDVNANLKGIVVTRVRADRSAKQYRKYTARA